MRTFPNGMACQMSLVLVGLALALSGCGSGDKKKSNDSPAQLTSQSVAGDMMGQTTLSGTATKLDSHFTLHFDADTLNMRIDGTVTTTIMDLPVAENLSLILDAGNKRATLHLQTKLPLPIPSCIYTESAEVPPVELMKKMLKEKMQNRKPDGMDGEYRRWAFDHSETGVATKVWVDLDDNNGLRKAYESVKVDQNKTQLESELTFTASNVTIGKPDASLFVQPKEWEPCVNKTSPGLDQPLLSVTSLLEQVVLLAHGPAVPSAQKAEASVVV